MNSFPKVYLAGPIAGLTYDGATDWRETVEKYLSNYMIAAVSPMRSKEYLKTAGIIHAYGYSDLILSSDKSIVTRDRFDVENCDVMLVNLLGAEKVSIGTMVEMGWADFNRKPMVVVMENGNIHVHAFVTELAGYVVDNLDSALFIIKAILETAW
jgi:nucleoside 2-deoxyribosyltransferase